MDEEKSLRRSITIKAIATRKMVDVISATVAAYCKEAEATEIAISDSVVAVSEAVDNVIYHAYPVDAPGEVEVKLSLVEANTLEAVIKDSGAGIDDIERAKKALFTTAGESGRAGMGFTVMENFADAVEVCGGVPAGTTVILRLNLGRG